MNAAKILIGTLLLISAFAANATLMISNESITPTSISFDISGAIEGPVPADGLSYLFFVDPTRPNGWINVFQNCCITSNISVNGSPNAVDVFFVEPDFGLQSHDRITLARVGGWNVGDLLSGTFSATWASAIDLTEFNGLELYWGRSGFSVGADETEGTFQATFGTSNVPSPATLFLMGLGLAVLGYSRRLRAIQLTA